MTGPEREEVIGLDLDISLRVDTAKARALVEAALPKGWHCRVSVTTAIPAWRAQAWKGGNEPRSAAWRSKYLVNEWADSEGGALLALADHLTHPEPVR